ncbi:hypothetical protein BKA64DRAFT_444119 [Cadophora sp. MPI-SDFR-AT-0126]|nr:hypothetical protein BKA64DRAFT_444119 [Leotiomycetes sp. MPI-SDFR-AT-0126]
MEEENAMSPSIYDEPRSPTGRIHPDSEISEEGAQKAVDVWNSLQSSPKAKDASRPQTSSSDLSRRKDFRSPSMSEQSSTVEEITDRRASAASVRRSVGSAAPGSEWSSVHGSEHARTDTVRTPGSESHADPGSISRRSTPQARFDAHHQSSTPSTSTGQQHTPLPSRIEQSPSQNAATASGSIARQLPEFSQPSPSNSGDPVGRPRIDETQVSSVRSTSNENHLNSSGESNSMREPQDLRNHGSRGTHDHRVAESHSPQGYHFPNAMGSPGVNNSSHVANMVPRNVPPRGSGPFTTFPSSFSVLTTESVQQKNLAQPGNKRGRKSASNDIEQLVSDAPIVAEQAVEKSASVIQQDGLPRAVSSISQTMQTSLPAQSGLPAIPVSHGFYQTTLPPRPTLTPPPGPSTLPSEAYRPPTIEFTINNEARSDLSPNDFQSFVDKFKRNARVVITGTHDPNCVHVVDVIMFQTLPWFYGWYSKTTGVAEVGALRFELIDVNWQGGNSIVVPKDNLLHFRALKQYIWDMYWVVMDMNKSLGQFRVSISPYPPRPEGEAATAPGWKAVKSSKGAAKFTSPPSSQRILVVPTGVSKKFQTQAQPSPPDHAVSIPPPPLPPSTSTDQLAHTDSQTSAHHITQPSPPNLPAGFPSPNQSTHQHGPSSGVPPAPPARQNETQVANLGQASHGYQSLYSPMDQMRSSWDQSLLRDYARSLKLPGTQLMHEESTIKDKLPYKTGAEVCAVVVDRMSGKGQVTVSGKGYVTLAIPTGPDETGSRFKLAMILPKQTCMLHGGAVVLYFKRADIPPPSSPGPMIPIIEADDKYAGGGQPPSLSYNQGMSHAAFRDDRPPPPPPLSQHSQYQQMLQSQKSQSTSSNPTSISASNVDIIIRVQVDGTGQFSIPFDKSVLRPKVTTTEFFSWFASQSRHSPPHPPRHLKFTFKDAMPTPQATEIVMGNEDHFNYMRKDIKAQCEKAKKFMPELKEFVILVTVPGWAVPDDGEEDW